MVTTVEATTADKTRAQQAESHKGRRQSRNKKSDPFLELSDDTLKLPEQPSPKEGDQNGSVESLIADLVLTPLNVISFVASLFLVERQQRQWRLSQHAPPQDSSAWSQFGVHGAEPYQDSRGTTWHPRLSWRRRNVAKIELVKVFEMRARVIVALITWSILAFLAISYVARRMFYWMF